LRAGTLFSGRATLVTEAKAETTAAAPPCSVIGESNFVGVRLGESFPLEGTL